MAILQKTIIIKEANLSLNQLMALDDLSAKQFLAIANLAAGETIEATAKKIKCNQNTIDVWLKQPTFKQALREAISEIYESSIADCVRTASAAVDTLKNILEDVDASRRDKIHAAKLILENASKWREWRIEERLEKLERIANGEYLHSLSEQSGTEINPETDQTE